MSALRQPRTFTFEEYLRIERESSYKSEYLDGIIYAMSGGTPVHSFIAANTITSLSNRLRGSGCRVATSDLMVATREENFSAYPDVTVVCGSVIPRDERGDILMNPCLVVEVLSPSTASHDRNEKFERYKRIASLRDYLLVSQEKPFVEHWHHGANGWELSTVEGIDATLPLISLHIELPLPEVYEGIFDGQP